MKLVERIRNGLLRSRARLVGATTHERDARPEEPRFFALNDLDIQLRRYLNKEGGFFVELGANDGVNQSNTLHLERELGWRGVLVEPIPHMYLQCLSNRGNGDKNRIYCAACVAEGYTKEFMPLIYSNLMTVSTDANLDLPDARAHAARGQQFLAPNECNFVFGALARTLTSILQEAEAPKTIDLLSLDVEGAELDVMMGLDFEQFAFEWMLIECRDKDRLIDFLRPHGYMLEAELSEQDLLFRNQGREV